jgi:hypothetical protein
MFFQKSKYDSCMHFVDVGESCCFGYENCPLSKFCGCWVKCLKVGIFLLDVYVGAGLLHCMGRTFQGQGSIPLEEMFMCLCSRFSLCVCFSLVSKCRHGHTFSKQICDYFQTPKANYVALLKIP